MSFFCFIQLRRRLYDDDSNFYCVFISDRIFKNRISIEFFVKWNAINNWCDWILLLLRKSIGFHVRKTFKKVHFFAIKMNFTWSEKFRANIYWNISKRHDRRICANKKNCKSNCCTSNSKENGKTHVFLLFFREITGLHKIHRK